MPPPSFPPAVPPLGCLATGGLSSSDEYVKLRARLDGVACAACGRDGGRKGTTVRLGMRAEAI